MIFCNIFSFEVLKHALYLFVAPKAICKSKQNHHYPLTYMPNCRKKVKNKNKHQITSETDRNKNEAQVDENERLKLLRRKQLWTS